MSLQLLITKAAFIGYEDLAANIETDRLNVAIRKAQELDLKNFLGNVFYYDLFKKVVFNEDGTINYTETPEIYTDLLRGKEYEDKQGNTLIYDGLAPALVYWSMARFTESDAVRYTNTGPTIKNHDEARGVSLTESSKLVANHRSIANSHVNDIICFLEINRASYPLYRYSERNANSRQPGPRLRSVDATDVRGRRGYNNGYGYYGLL